MKETRGFVAGGHATDRAVTFTVRASESNMKALRDNAPPGGPVGMKPAQYELFTEVVAL